MDISLEEFVAEKNGAQCRVYEQDGKLCYEGTIGGYTPEKKTLHINLFQQGHHPGEGKKETEVRIHVFTSALSNKVSMLYGTILDKTATYCLIELSNLISCEDQREVFREKIGLEGSLEWLDAPQKRTSCILVDISMTGACIHCKYDREVGQNTRLKIVQIRDGGPGYDIHGRVVRRIQPDPTEYPTLWEYGISFDDLTERQEDQLCQDLLLLQAKRRKRMEMDG